MRARRIGIGVLVVVAALLGGGWLYVRSVTPKLELGIGYAARVACGCRWMGNRSLESCYRDFEPGMEPIRLREDAGARTVTAYVPLVAKRTVRFDPVLGCQPEPFGGERARPDKPPP